MLPAVEFDNEVPLTAGEVGIVATDRLLADEFARRAAGCESYLHSIELGACQ